MKTAKIIAFLLLFLTLIAVPVFGQNYSGASTCQSCHNNSMIGGTQYTQWSLTRHSQAYDSVSFVKSKTDCAPCHTTGWDTTTANQGADDYVTRNGDGTFTVNNATEFAKKVNVQCEDCHGPVEFGVNHGYPPTPGSLQNPKAEICGRCHQGDHQPEYPEWQTSLHSMSDTNASPFLTNMFRTNANCSACHTYQGFLQNVNDTSIVPNIANPPGAAALPLVCAACHNPHSNTIDKQLRLSKEQLCQKCHNPEYDPAHPAPGTEIHNTASFMLEAKGGYEYAGYTYQSSMHKYAVTDKCVTCHMHSTPYVSGTQPATTGHTFEPKGKACVGCHVDFDTLAATFDFRRVQTTTDSIANVLSAKLAAATSTDSATDAFKRAKFNYDFVEADMSHGVHNTQYAQGLLKSAIANFTPTSVEEFGNAIPKTFELGQNYPNPFNPTTKISFTLPVRNHVRLQIYDIAGNLVSTLVDLDMSPGNYRITWNGNNNNGVGVTTGVYLYKLEAGSFTQTKKMLLMK
jgi:predicted CXXCH cytochrome family protein